MMDAQDVRFKIAAARRMLYREGCDSQVAGQVSARVPGEDALLTSVYEYLDETLPGAVIKLSFAFEILEAPRDGREFTVAPALDFHSEIYRQRPDVQSIVHHHGHYTAAVSTTGQFVGQYNVLSNLFYDDQALISDLDEGSGTESKRVAAQLADKSVLLMKNHGVVVVGDSVENAAVKSILIEKAAQFHLEAVAVGGTELSDVKHLLDYRDRQRRFVVPEVWAAQVRRLRRSDPDLFDSLTTQ